MAKPDDVLDLDEIEPEDAAPPLRDPPWYELDGRLRAAGFVIAERKQGREPVWRRGKDRFTQTDAVKLLPLVKAAKNRNKGQ